MIDEVHIQARDLGEAWWLLIREIFKRGRSYTIDRGSHQGGTRLEFEFVTVQVAYPGTRPLVPQVPDGAPAPTNQDYIDEYMSYWMTDDPPKENEQYTYGQDIYPQYAEAVRIYKEDGYNTNQVTMSVGSRESIKLEHSQCLRLIDTRIMDGRLVFFVTFRSWDLYGGFPSNMAALQLIKESMASEIGVADGELIGISKGLHLYGHSLEMAKLAVSLG